MSVDITTPSQRALAMWANLIIEISPPVLGVVSIMGPVPDVSNHEVQDAFTELLNTLGEKYVRLYFLTFADARRWRDTPSDGDVRYLRALVQLQRAAAYLEPARAALSKALRQVNTKPGDND